MIIEKGIAAILSFIMLVGVLPLPFGVRAAENEYFEKTGTCVIETEYVLEGSLVEIIIKIDAIEGFCGALFSLDYDADVFSASLCEAYIEGMVFSYFDSGSRVCLLLDGLENSFGGCVRLGFEGIDAVCEDAIFFMDVIEIYRVGESGELEAVSADVREREIVIEAEKKEGLCVLDAELLLRDDGRLEVIICGEISGGYFAVGIKIFAIELESGRCEMIYVYEVRKSGDGEGYELRVPLSMSGKLSLVVTPLAYSREIVEGEKTVFTFLN